jgi:hypothetical protein
LAESAKTKTDRLAEVCVYRLLVALLMGATSLSVAWHQFEELEASQHGRGEPESLPAFCSDIGGLSPTAEHSVQAVMFPDPAALVTDVTQWVIDEYCKLPSS